MIVRKCSSSQVELDWIKSEAKKGYYELGFLPWPAILRYADAGSIYLLENGGELLSFVIIHSHARRLAVYQMWTREDVRRHSFAKSLLDIAIPQANKKWEKTISLWCRAELDANYFWRAMGFLPIAQRLGGTVRKATQICYQRRLDQDQLRFEGFADVPLELSQLRIVEPSRLRGRRITKNSGPRRGDASSSSEGLSSEF